MGRARLVAITGLALLVQGCGGDGGPAESLDTTLSTVAVTAASSSTSSPSIIEGDTGRHQ